MSKSKRQKVMEEGRDDLNGVLERLKEIAAIAAAEPYLTDAQGFLTQAIVCLEKQLVSEFDWKPPEKPVVEPKPEAAKPARMEKKAAAK